MKKILIIAITFAIGFFGFQYVFNKYKSSSEENKIKKNQEETEEWVSIFDGETFSGWHNYLTDTISDEWQIKDGAMVFTPNPERKHGINNLMTDKEYTSFILSIDWKISERGNSGIFWGVFEDEKYAIPYLTGAEIQVLDEMAFLETNRQTHRAGSVYDMIGPSELAVNDLTEWNTCVLEVNHKTNEGNVWLNGTHIVTFPVHGPGWEKLIANSKFKDWELFGTFRTGRIGVQDHGAKVAYKNIKIKEL